MVSASAPDAGHLSAPVSCDRAGHESMSLVLLRRRCRRRLPGGELLLLLLLLLPLLL